MEKIVVIVAGINFLDAEGEDMGFIRLFGADVGGGQATRLGRRVHGDEAVALVEFQFLKMAFTAARGHGAGAFQERDEEDDRFAKAGEYAGREGGDGFIDEIAQVIGGEGNGGGVVGKDGAEGCGILVKSFGEVAEVQFGFVQAGKISGWEHRILQV